MMAIRTAALLVMTLVSGGSIAAVGSQRVTGEQLVALSVRAADLRALKTPGDWSDTIADFSVNLTDNHGYQAGTVPFLTAQAVNNHMMPKNFRQQFSGLAAPIPVSLSGNKVDREPTDVIARKQQLFALPANTPENGKFLLAAAKPNKPRRR